MSYQRMMNGFTKLGQFFNECKPSHSQLPDFRQAVKRLPKKSELKKTVLSSGFMQTQTILYKYIKKSRAKELLEANLLYCDTIENCREGTWGDPFESSFIDMTSILLSNAPEAYELLNSMLSDRGLDEYDPYKMYRGIYETIGKQRICCMSESPYIEEMWEWKGKEKALCIPIDVSGLNFYKVLYDDEKVDPEPYANCMKDMLLDAFVEKVSRKDVQ